MAARQGRNTRMGPRIRDYGCFSVHGPRQPRISLPKDSLPIFGASIGDTVRIELIEPDDEPAYYEIRPEGER